MELKGLISDEVLQAVQKSYDSESYTNSIKDGIQFLLDYIREQTGLITDGDALITAAFSVEKPLIKMNKLQTQSEKDLQVGTMMLFQGLYKAIRNPRIHGSVHDNEKTAYLLIAFLDYLYSSIAAAEIPFNFDKFLQGVNDKYFVRTKQYVNELIKSIPQNKRLEVLIKLFNQRESVNILNLSLIIGSIFPQLDTTQQEEFEKVLIEAQRHDADRKLVILTYSLSDPEKWKLKEKRTKLRMEKIIVDCLEKATYLLEEGNDNPEGQLATWAIRFLGSFENKSELRNLINTKLKSYYTDNLYVFRWILPILPKLYDTDISRDTILGEIKETVNTENESSNEYLDLLQKVYYQYPKDWTKRINELLPRTQDWESIPF